MKNKGNTRILITISSSLLDVLNDASQTMGISKSQLFSIASKRCLSNLLMDLDNIHLADADMTRILITIPLDVLDHLNNIQEKTGLRKSQILSLVAQKYLSEYKINTK